MKGTERKPVKKIRLNKPTENRLSNHLARVTLTLALLIPQSSQTILKTKKNQRSGKRFTDTIYEGDLVISGMEEEFLMLGVKNLYFSTNESREAFKVLNIDNNYQTNQRGGTEAQRNCTKDSLEVRSGIIIALNCDFSLDFYGFTDALVSIRRLKTEMLVGKNLTLRECSLIKRSVNRSLNFLVCDNMVQNNLEVFLINGQNLEVDHIGTARNASFDSFDQIIMSYEEEQLIIIVLKSDVKQVFRHTLPVAKFTEDVQASSNRLSFERIYFSSEELIKDKKNYTSGFIPVLGKIMFVIATPLPRSRNEGLILSLVELGVSSQKHTITIKGKKNFEIAQILMVGYFDVKVKFLESRRSREGEVIFFMPRTTSMARCRIKWDNSHIWCLFDKQKRRSTSMTTQDLQPVRFFPNEDGDGLSFNWTLFQSVTTKRFVGISSGTSFLYEFHQTSNVEAFSLAQKWNVIFFNNSKLFRRVYFGKAQETLFLVNSSKLFVKKYLPEIRVWENPRQQDQPTRINFTKVGLKSRFLSLKVKSLQQTLTVDEVSIIFLLGSFPKRKYDNSFSLEGNPTKLSIQVEHDDFRDSVTQFDGCLLDVYYDLKIDHENESLSIIDNCFLIENHKTNQIKIWASCWLHLRPWEQKINCKASAVIGIEEDYKIISSVVSKKIYYVLEDRHRPWYRYYGIIELSNNKTCLIQVTFRDKAGSNATKSIRQHCWPQIYRFSSFSMMGQTNRHCIVHCTLSSCDFFTGEFRGDEYKFRRIYSFNSSNQIVRQGLKIQFVKAINWDQEKQEKARYSLFFIKSQLKSRENFTSYYHISIKNLGSRVTVNEINLLHFDYNLSLLPGNSYLISKDRNTLYQYYLWDRRFSMLLYDRRVSDFGIETIVKAFPLGETQVAVLGRSSKEKPILIVIEPYTQTASYNLKLSTTNLNCLRFRKEYNAGEEILDVFPVGLSPGFVHLWYKGMFVVKYRTPSDGKTHFLLQSTLNVALISVKIIKPNRLKTNLTLKFSNPQVHKSISYEIYLRKSWYDFALELPNRNKRVAIEEGFTPLSSILKYKHQPIKIELLNDIQVLDNTNSSPKLIKKYTLTKSKKKHWTLIKRHHNKILLPININHPLKSPVDWNDANQKLIFQTDDKIGFILNSGEEEVYEFRQNSQSRILGDVYYYEKEGITYVSFIEIVKKYTYAIKKVKTLISVHIFDRNNAKIGMLQFTVMINRSPINLFLFRPENAEYLVLFVRSQYKISELFEIKPNSIRKITEIDLTKLKTPNMLQTIRSKRSLTLIVASLKKYSQMRQSLIFISYKFDNAKGSEPTVTRSSFFNRFDKELYSIVCRELDSPEYPEYGSHCVIEYKNYLSFYLRIRNDFKSALEYSSPLLGGTQMIGAYITMGLAYFSSLNYWDLNEDLIVRIKQGQTPKSKFGIAIWELKDRSKYKAEGVWASKYNEIIFRLGFCTRVLLRKSESYPEMVSILFNQEDDYEDTTIRYNLTAQEGIYVPNLPFLDININLISLQFTYGDGTLKETVSLSKLVYIPIPKVETEDGTLYLGILLVVIIILSLFIFAWLYCLCVRMRAKRIYRRREREIERTLTKKQDGDLTYQSLDVSSVSDLGDIELEEGNSFT